MTGDHSRIRYACQRCGNCCRHPGEVPVSDVELRRMADYLDLSVYDFVAANTDLRLNRTGLTLREKPGGECIFLEGANRCRVHPVKPDQCAGFPNRWTFDGWEKVCEALPELEPAEPDSAPQKD